MIKINPVHIFFVNFALIGFYGMLVSVDVLISLIGIRLGLVELNRWGIGILSLICIITLIVGLMSLNLLSKKDIRFIMFIFILCLILVITDFICIISNVLLIRCIIIV